MGIFILRPIKKNKVLRRQKGQVRKMCRKGSFGPIVWIVLTGLMLCSLLLPGNIFSAGWLGLESSLREGISLLLKDCQKGLKMPSENNGLKMPMPWVCSTLALLLRKLISLQLAREHQKEPLMMERAASRDTSWATSMTQESKTSSTFLSESWSQKRTQLKGSSIQLWTQFGSYYSQ